MFCHLSGWSCYDWALIPLKDCKYLGRLRSGPKDTFPDVLHVTEVKHLLGSSLNLDAGLLQGLSKPQLKKRDRNVDPIRQVLGKQTFLVNFGRNLRNSSISMELWSIGLTIVLRFTHVALDLKVWIQTSLLLSILGPTMDVTMPLSLLVGHDILHRITF